MLQSFSPSRCWDYESEPLLFDEEICQLLMKDLHSLPTPPQSPPMKPSLDNPLSNVDQLELMSELLEGRDLMQLSWNCDLLCKDGLAETDSLEDQRPEVSDDCLWRCLGDKFAEEKLPSVLSGPLLSDIDTNIFEEIAGSTLDCHGAALLCQNDDLSVQTESSDTSSLSAASDSSASESDEEIDVVTVKWRGLQGEVPRQSRAAAKRCHLEIQQQEIQLQHNYAAPRPASPCRSEPPKRARGDPPRLRQHLAPGDPEDEEERRRTHNVMERQRRNELKNCFLRLRDHVPELSHNDKASKVQILKKARESIRGLEAEMLRLASKRERLRQRQEQLRARMEQLRR
ncbi:hypothetical protein GJAV_G00181300 [Gymnothorax javanicus]|nr:hypothetical protein GJAV_G00181300 [Gymnothorax javanicus]